MRNLFEKLGVFLVEKGLKFARSHAVHRGLSVVRDAVAHDEAHVVLKGPQRRVRALADVPMDSGGSAY